MTAQTLSTRQREICDLLAMGLQNKEIAKQLGIGHRTVETHRQEIYRRLGVRNAVELVRKMMGMGNEASQTA